MRSNVAWTFWFSLTVGLTWTARGQLPPASRVQEDVIRAMERAYSYLASEEAFWRENNQCFSCHNQGIGLWALWLSGAAVERPKFDVPESLIQWLGQPNRWRTVQDPGGGDERLADLHFGRVALLGHERKLLALEPHIQEQIARRVAAHLKDHRWPADRTSSLASPLSLGPAWGTLLACSVLEAVDAERWSEQIKSSHRSILTLNPQNVPDAAARWVVAVRRREEAALMTSWDFLRRSQNSDGGWGPFPNRPSEPFDTALVLIAFSGTTNYIDQTIPDIRVSIDTRVRQAHAFLLARQESTGAWPATTRPAGLESYPLKIATTAWVVEALWRTRAVPLPAADGQAGTLFP